MTKIATPTIQQLIYAVTLQKNGTYNRASEQLGISQPALSLQIKKLEDILGFKLFERGRKVYATPRGVKYLSKAELVVNEFSQLDHLSDLLVDEVAGRLDIGIIPTLAPYLLPLFLDDLNLRYPELNIHVHEELTEDIVSAVKGGELDAGIISTPIQSSYKFEIMPLFYEEFKLFVSPEHPLFNEKEINTNAINPTDIWLLKEGNCFRDQVNNICEIAKDYHQNHLFYFESNSIESLCRIVEFKGGITFLPELTTLHLDEERLDLVKEIQGNKKVREISLITTPYHIKSEEIRKFCEVVKENIPKKMLKENKRTTIPTNVTL